LCDSLDEKHVWSSASACGHAGVGVAEWFFGAGAAVADDEGALADLPEGDAAVERGQQLGFGAGEAEGVAGPVELVGGLAVDDPGLGVGEEAFGQRAFARAGGAGGLEVGEAVDDDDVLGAVAARELEGLLQPLPHPDLADDLPALVVDADDLAGVLVAGFGAVAQGSLMTARWNAAAQIIRMPIASLLYMAERSSTTQRALKSRPGEVEPSNMPASSP